jgi:hypothetical protein
VRPLTERLSCLNSDMVMALDYGSWEMRPAEVLRRAAGLTRLAPIRRQVKRA